MYMHMRTNLQKPITGAVQAWGFPLSRNRSFNSSAKLSSLSWSKPKGRRSGCTQNYCCIICCLQVTHHLFDICEDKYDETDARYDGYLSREPKEHRVNNIHNAFAAALRARRSWVGGTTLLAVDPWSTIKWDMINSDLASYLPFRSLVLSWLIRSFFNEWYPIWREQ